MYQNGGAKFNKSNCKQVLQNRASLRLSLELLILLLNGIHYFMRPLDLKALEQFGTATMYLGGRRLSNFFFYSKMFVKNAKNVSSLNTILSLSVQSFCLSLQNPF